MIVLRRTRSRSQGPRRSDLDDLMRALVSPAGVFPRQTSGTWRPPIDVFEAQDRVVIVAELAGMDREEIEISLEGDVVVIRGNRPDRTAREQRSFHEAHIAYGTFAAEVHVPGSIDVERATATYENGFLTIDLPRLPGRTIVATNPNPDPSAGRSSA